MSRASGLGPAGRMRWWCGRLLAWMSPLQSPPELPSDEFVAFQERFALACRLRVGGHRGPGPPEWEVVARWPAFGAVGRPDLGLRQFLTWWSDDGIAERV